MVTTKWLASLSDGTTAVEGEGKFAQGGGVLMWDKLLAHLLENNLTMTALRVQVLKGGEPTNPYNLPSCRLDNKSGQHEKWNYIHPMVPHSYEVRRCVTRAMNTGGKILAEQIQIEAIARYDDFTVSLFVDQNEGNEAWVVIHKEQE